MNSEQQIQERKETTKILAAFIVIALIGMFDYLTGAEIRIFPLYYFPISYGAWYSKRRDAILLAFASLVAWLVSNQMAGLSFSTPAIWAINISAQTVSFLLIALLITRLRDANERERHQARHDGLTGLLNGRAFYEILRYEASRSLRYDSPLTLGYIDLDNFKGVNDTKGHQVGDELLQRVADILTSVTRKSDIVARLGGDEFIVLLPETDEKESKAAFEKIASTLQTLMKNNQWPVTASIGVATFKRPPEEPEELVAKVDATMYMAKQSGKNRIEYSVN